LLLDHSGRTEDSMAVDGTTETLEEGLRLTEEEETTLVEVASTALARVKKEQDKSKVSSLSLPRDDANGLCQTEDDDGQLTRTLVPFLPRLLEKYHTEPSRALSVLQIPLLMNMELYLDMRIIGVCLFKCS
jgi:cohesin complex subunit SA-1/2